MLFLSRRSRRRLEHKIKRQGHLETAELKIHLNTKALISLQNLVEYSSQIDRTLQKTIENSSFSGTNNSSFLVL